jgi:hypothetical protein
MSNTKDFKVLKRGNHAGRGKSLSESFSFPETHGKIKKNITETVSK